MSSPLPWQVHIVEIYRRYVWWLWSCVCFFVVLCLKLNADLLVYFNPQAVTFEDWVKATFIVCFLMSCFMGYVTVVQLELWSYCGTANTNLFTLLSQLLFVFVFFQVCLDVFYSFVQLLQLSTYNHSSGGNKGKNATKGLGFVCCCSTLQMNYFNNRKSFSTWMWICFLSHILHSDE